MISWVSVPGVRCNIYVDDTGIYFSGTTTDTVRHKPQGSVNQALNWFKSNNMTINATKSFTMLICNSCNIHHYASLTCVIRVHGTNLEQFYQILMRNVRLGARFDMVSHIDYV